MSLLSSFVDAFYLMLFLMLVDTICGVLIAGKRGNIQSTIFGRGTRTKLVTILIVMGIEAFAIYLRRQGQATPQVGTYACLAMATWELLSTLEFAERAGIGQVRMLRPILQPLFKLFATSHTDKAGTKYTRADDVQQIINAINDNGKQLDRRADRHQPEPELPPVQEAAVQP